MYVRLAKPCGTVRENKCKPSKMYYLYYLVDENWSLLENKVLYNKTYRRNYLLYKVSVL